MTKIALLFTGHYRSFDKTYSAWKSKFIDKHDVDVYMHIWDNIGNRLDLQVDEVLPEKGSHALATFSDEKIDTAKIINQYSITNLIIENYKEVEEKERFKERVVNIKNEFLLRGLGDRRMSWFLSQYYKRLKGVEQVLASGIIYDFIFLVRPDFEPGYFPKDCRFHGNPEDLKQDNVASFLYSEEEQLFMTTMSEFDGYHDFYIIGRPSVVYEVCKIYYEIDFLSNFFAHREYFKMSCGHALLTSFVRDIRQIPVKEIPLVGYIKR